MQSELTFLVWNGTNACQHSVCLRTGVSYGVRFAGGSETHAVQRLEGDLSEHFEQTNWMKVPIHEICFVCFLCKIAHSNFKEMISLQCASDSKVKVARNSSFFVWVWLNSCLLNFGSALPKLAYPFSLDVTPRKAGRLRV